MEALVKRKMADVDTIFEEDDEEEAQYMDDMWVFCVPDPIVIRGAGNITV